MLYLNQLWSGPDAAGGGILGLVHSLGTLLIKIHVSH